MKTAIDKILCVLVAVAIMFVGWVLCILLFTSPAESAETQEAMLERLSGEAWFSNVGVCSYKASMLFDQVAAHNKRHPAKADRIRMNRVIGVQTPKFGNRPAQPHMWCVAFRSDGTSYIVDPAAADADLYDYSQTSIVGMTG